jgi:Polyketide cyclase / dehydrase and lipid transport
MADKTSSSLTMRVPLKAVMSVIADLPAYPEWASGVRSAQVLEVAADGRPSLVRITLDAGIIKDTYVLRYAWDGDTRVRWQLVQPGSMISEMTGGYLLTDRGEDTEVTFDLTVGLRIPVLSMLKRRAEKAIIDTALSGLRQRAEGTRPRGDAGMGATG